MLQTYARRHNIPIDHLKFDFHTTNVTLDQDEVEIEHKKAGKEVCSVEAL